MAEIPSNYEPRKTRVDVRGSYAMPHRRVEVNSMEDLVANRIHVNPDAVASTFGPRHAEMYKEAMYGRPENGVRATVASVQPRENQPNGK